ncbi:hypothetical protein LCGC14_1731230, partial [marine sediment metagenome]
MRVGIVRTDLGRGIYLADVESAVQRNFSSEPPGQSRNIRRPTLIELEAPFVAYPLPVNLTGSDTNALVDTSSNDTLRIRVAASDAFTVIAVTSGVSTAKTDIRDDLNTAFASNSLPFLAKIVGTNQIRIYSTGTNTGESARLENDTFANGSTLNTPLGFTDGSVNTVPSHAANVTALLAVVYPTSVTIDVSTASLVAFETVVDLSSDDQTAIIAAIADLVAPQLVETGLVELSFVQGILS